MGKLGLIWGLRPVKNVKKKALKLEFPSENVKPQWLYLVSDWLKTYFVQECQSIKFMLEYASAIFQYLQIF